VHGRERKKEGPDLPLQHSEGLCFDSARVVSTCVFAWHRVTHPALCAIILFLPRRFWTRRVAHAGEVSNPADEKREEAPIKEENDDRDKVEQRDADSWSTVRSQDLGP